MFLLTYGSHALRYTDRQVRSMLASARLYTDQLALAAAERGHDGAGDTAEWLRTRLVEA